MAEEKQKQAAKREPLTDEELDKVNGGLIKGGTPTKEQTGGEDVVVLQHRQATAWSPMV